MQRQHAVVLGGSMTGLAVASVLARHFAKVTVVERDRITQASLVEGRKGVPQGNQVHALLASGYAFLDRAFPGLMDELRALGAGFGDVTGDFLWHQFGAYKLRAPVGLRGVIASRPTLEGKVRERVLAMAQVQLLEGTDVVEPVFDAAGGKVTGVRVADHESKEATLLTADFVVDATGRGSQAPKWLAGWGFPAVAESVVEVDVGYVTAQFERRAGDIHGGLGGVFVATPPASSRGGAAFAIEGDRWAIGMFGSLGDHPPAEIDGFRAFARTLPTQDLASVVAEREPVTKLYAHRFPANRWRHFEKLERFPEQFLVMGDAVCSFNPTYGQGMSVGLLEADALDRMLGSGTQELARRFFTEAARIINVPWSIAVGEDLRFPAVRGPRPFGTGFIHRYMERAHRVAGDDVVVLRQFFQVANLLAQPTAMLAPHIALRVLRGPRAHAS